MIGTGQHLWLRMWDDTNAEDPVIANGVLYPGENFAFKFEQPQTVTHVSLTRITKEQVETLIAEKGIKQAFPTLVYELLGQELDQHADRAGQEDDHG